MNTLLHRDDDDSADQLTDRNDREITLGPTVIFGIFFALVALCAVFFGFGYTMGRKATVAAVTLTPTETLSSTNFSGFKPAAGSATPSEEIKAGPPPPTTLPHTPPPTTAIPPATGKLSDRSLNAESASGAEVKPTAHSAIPYTPSATIPAIVPTGGSTMVQVAAVSHQEDADLLMTTLKRRGYAVAIHAEPQDKLLHVQIGPFPTHKDADVMRQRLLADGFNAIVKDPTK